MLIVYYFSSFEPFILISHGQWNTYLTQKSSLFYQAWGTNLSLVGAQNIQNLKKYEMKSNVLNTIKPIWKLNMNWRYWKLNIEHGLTWEKILPSCPIYWIYWILAAKVDVIFATLPLFQLPTFHSLSDSQLSLSEEVNSSTAVLKFNSAALESWSYFRRWTHLQLPW